MLWTMQMLRTIDYRTNRSDTYLISRPLLVRSDARHQHEKQHPSDHTGIEYRDRPKSAATTTAQEDQTLENEYRILT
jgi:hypothetical protein